MTLDSLPQITVQQLSERMKSQDQFILLDVRELWELELARIQDHRVEVLPMSQLARTGPDALPAAARAPGTVIFVLCHQGVRSARVAQWLASRGWSNVFSVAGGIEEYARKVDSSVGSY